MKKIAIIISGILLSASAFCQPLIQASIGVGSDANSVRIYLKPAVAITPASGAISTLQYSIALPATTLPVPTMTIVSTSILSGFTIDGPRLVDGFLIYNLTTAVSATVNIPAAETQAMEVRFSNGGTIPSNVSLATLAQGGTYDGNALFYCTGAAASQEGQLYYARTGTSVTNTNSYTGFTPSFATITGVVLPVKLTDFAAVKKSHDGLLNWNLQNQDALADHFEIERSFNGTDFSGIGRTEATTNATGTVSYNYTDVNIDALKTNIVFYHIKSVDKNGVITYTETRSLRVSDKMINVNLYPNPAATYTNLSYDLPEASAALIKVIDPSGKEVMAAEVQAQKGLNRQRINVSNYASGKYIVTIKTATETQNISFMKGN